MNKLYILGDCHLSLARDWDKEIFEKFIKWFSEYDFGNKEEVELIQLGDLFERSSNLGGTLELAAKFIQICSKKFKTIYLLGGNHDFKTLNSKYYYATQFLYLIGERDQIKTIFEEQIFITRNGFHILALPYRRVEGKILDDYYSNELSEDFYETKVDLLCGHVAIKEKGSFYGGINYAKFKHYRASAFGHIHSRNGTYREEYVGSIMPFKIDEEKTELPRIMKVLSKGTTLIEEQPVNLPIFVKYETIKFGDKIKNYKDNLTRVFTVTNCKNVQLAKSQYPNAYIRGVEKILNNVNVKTGEKVEHFISPLNALENMISETKLVIKRKTLEILKSLLKGQQ